MNKNILTPEEHHNIANLIEEITSLIENLTGFPGDRPFCFKRCANENVRQEVQKYFQNFIFSEFNNNFDECHENLKEFGRYEKLINAIINALGDE